MVRARFYVAVVFDKMKVKEGLVYNKRKCQMVGLVNLGDINNQLLPFEEQLENGGRSHHVTKQMVVFMVSA